MTLFGKQSYFLIFLASFSFAAESAPSGSPYYFQEMDPDEIPNPKPVNSVPKRGIRERAFESAGLKAELVAMDELSRDLLYLRARRLEKAELFRSYPRLSQEKLGKLQDWIRGSKR